MASPENVLPASDEAFKESLPTVSEAMVANMLQISLMPLAFKARHPEIEVDMKNPEFTHKDKVIQEWVQQDAAIFRRFIENNPDRTIDLSDPEDLATFLQQMWDYETRH